MVKIVVLGLALAVLGLAIVVKIVVQRRRPTAWADHLVGTVQWPGDLSPAGPPAHAPQAGLHYVDVGSAFINTSLLAFVASYPRGPEFNYHLIEPNPRVVRLYTRELEELGVPPAQVEVLQAAAWVTDNHTLKSAGLGLANAALSPTLQSFGSRKLKMLARRILNAHPRFGGCSVESDCGAWEAQTLDLARWIHERFSLSDYVVLKLDIEGGEWTVIPHLLARTGAAALIDELYIEWHPDDVGLQQRSREAFLGNMSVFRRRESDVGPLVQQLKEAGVKVVGRWP